MKRFAELFEGLDATTSTNAKVALLEAYFREAPPADACWGLHFLSGRRFKRLLGPGELRRWATELTGLPPWLFEEAHVAVGDLAETVALLLPPGEGAEDLPLSRWVEERILPLRERTEEQRRADVRGWWSSLPSRELFLLNKMLTGSLRVGVSSGLVNRALAAALGTERTVVAHRLAGSWWPSADVFRALGAPADLSDDASRPYPFFLASPLDGEPASLGERGEWQAEWKWDGIRAQVVRRESRTWIWSRGEELVTERFPEIELESRELQDGTVLDGEILAWKDGRPLPFAILQRRIGRKTLGPAILSDAPVAFVAYDLLESAGRDLRDRPLRERREELVRIVGERESRLRLSPPLEEDAWSELAVRRAESRSRLVEGLVLKRLDSPYRTGRVRGDWWKWKVEPYRVDAVLVYAQAGRGRRSNMYTDYTFAVWDGDELRTLAKAYSGLSDAEIRELDRWIRRNGRERFGPVRAVEPQQVFELAFDGLAPSSRHGSGLAVRFPRIARWRKDKQPEDADTLESVKALVDVG